MRHVCPKSTLISSGAGPRAALFLAAASVMAFSSACRPSIDDNLPEPEASSSASLTISDGSITPAKLSQAYLPLAGGTLTGDLTLPANPTAAMHASTKTYTDSNVGGLAIDTSALSSIANNQALVWNSTTSKWTPATVVGGANATQIQGSSVSAAGSANGQLLIFNSGASTWNPATLTGTANQVTVTNGAGSITLALPQNIHSAATPTFAGLTLTGALSMSGTQKITNLATPTASADAATKGYVDAASATVAPPSVFSLTANSGLYNNQIAEMTPTAAYTEVCFKSGTTKYDIHAANEATTAAATVGGSSGVGSNDCSPGDVGFIIERAERAAQTWTQAKKTCNQMQMRLPEPYEWKLACDDAATWSISTMTNNWEWGSNFALPMYYGANNGVGSAVFGSGGCTYATWDWLGYGTGSENPHSFRCVR